MLKKFSVVDGWCGRVIIVSALSLRDQDRDKEKERARERELDNKRCNMMNSKNINPTLMSN